MNNKLLTLLLTGLAMTSLDISAMGKAKEVAGDAAAVVANAAGTADCSMKINETGYRTIQIILAVMLSSGIFGQAVRAFEHDTGLKLSSWAPTKHLEALVGSVAIGYLASDLADDGKINTPLSSIHDEHGHITWQSVLGFFFRKALWTVPAYAGWIGIAQAVNQPVTEEHK